jgi:apolipoprotein N-acyltransferase
MRWNGFPAWLVAACLIVAVERSRTFRQAAGAGAVFGVLAALLGDAAWVATAVHRYFGASPWAASVLVGLCAIAYGVVFGAVLGVALARLRAWPDAWRAAFCGAIWAAWESMITSVIPHHPWVSLAATQSRQPAALQIAALVGQSGLSFAIACGGACAGIALLRRHHPTRAVRYLLAGSLIAAACIAGGWLRMHVASIPPTACSLTAIDAGVTQADVDRGPTRERYETATDAALRTHTDAVVWPESALLASPQLDRDLARRLRDDVRRWGTVLIAGGPRFGWQEDWKARPYNSVYRLDADGPIQTYDKRMLVPFAESWPALLPKPTSASDDVVAGATPAVFAVGSCRLGILICFEGEHPGAIRDAVDAGASALLLVSNDAHLPRYGIDQQLSQLALRAVESGMPIIRAANHGTSVVFDRFGRVEQRTRGGSLRVEVRPGQPAPALWTASYFTALCWILALTAVAWPRRS